MAVSIERELNFGNSVKKKVGGRKDGAGSRNSQEEGRTEAPGQKNPTGDLFSLFSNPTQPDRKMVWAELGAGAWAAGPSSRRRGWQRTAAGYGWSRLWLRHRWHYPAASPTRCWSATATCCAEDRECRSRGLLASHIFSFFLHLFFSYLSCGDCLDAPGPEDAGMGPGWKAWLGDVVAERAR